MFNAFTLLHAETPVVPEYQDLVTIPDIEDKWKELGYALMIDSQSLDAIEAKYGRPQPAKQKRDMFRLAVKNGITWKQLVAALCDINLRDVARDTCSTFLLNGLSSIIAAESVSEVRQLFEHVLVLIFFIITLGYCRT